MSTSYLTLRFLSLISSPPSNRYSSNTQTRKNLKLMICFHSGQKVLENVTSRFSVADCGPGKIQELKTIKGDAVSTVLGLQPYSALVLADLIYAHGAEDEAIAILAEWLSLFQKNEKARMDEGEATPRWWELRVRSRIALWMADVAGQNNFA